MKETSSQQMQFKAIQGCLLGTAIGDSLGLPFEGMSPQRIKKLNPLPLRHRFLFNRGMLSDDTAHTCLVAQSLIVSGENSQLFTKQLARRLRWWLFGLPAGIGMATLKSLIKLSFGVSNKWCQRTIFSNIRNNWSLPLFLHLLK